MKRLVWWMSRLYPPAWQERYGAEFEALLEDADLKAGDLWDVFKGAGFMRLTSINFVTITAACAIAGAIIGGVATLGPFSGYTSRGALSVQAATEDRLTATAALQQAVQTTLSRSSLAEMMSRPSLNLYREERARMPLEDVIQLMRRNILVQFRGYDKGRLNVAVEFQYPDAAAAQRTTAALMDRLRQEVPRNSLVQIVQVEVAQPPAQAQPAAEGKRPKLIGIALVLGLLAGIVIGGILSLWQNRRRWSLQRIALCAAAGAALGLVVAFFIPDVFISSAVVRTARPIDPNAVRLAAVHDDDFNRTVRNEDLSALRVEQAQPASLTPNANVYVISFQDHDPARAQSMTRAMLAAWLKTGSVQEIRTEVLDPASYPGSPVSPNRLTIALLGLAAGTLVGLAAARPRHAPAAA